jgi:Fe-S-cluster-containing dehydrogenase component
VSEEKDKVDKSKGKQVSRREFLKDAGLVAGGAAVGSMAILSACGTDKTITETKNSTLTSTVTSTVTQPATTVTVEKVVDKIVEVEKLVSVPKSDVIEWDATKCVSCARCMQACSTVHEGGTSPTLTAIRWFENKWFDGWDGEVPAYPMFCQQCSSPECYFVCPLKDQALCIDAKTGARYINKANCTGCGLCVMACPLSPPRLQIDPGQKKAIKCDMCKDRAGGPVCVYVCDRLALSVKAKEARL